MYQKPSVPRSIGGVLDDILQLYKASFSSCLVAALLNGVAAGVLGLYQVSRLPVIAAGTPDLRTLLIRSVANTPMSSLVSLLAIVLELVFYGILVYIVCAVSRGSRPSFGESFPASMRRLPAMIGATILIFIAAFVGFAVMLVPIIFALAGRQPGGNLAEIVSLIGPAMLVSFLLSIPVIYVVSRMVLYMVPLVSESKGPVQSIAMSWRLVGGNWWHTSTVVFVMTVIVYILTMVVVGIADGIAVMASGIPKSGAQVLATAALVGAGVGGVVRVFSAPLMAAMSVSIYSDLLLRKGGADLEARLGALPKG